jgi:bifunctional non-homologous end joining protein LigD
MIFDIDPSPEVEWPEVVAAAKTVKALLEKCGFVTFPMTTGGKGLHVVTPLKPLAGWDEVIAFAEAIARFLEATQPDKFTANLSKKKRVGRAFVDYLRNHKTASAVLPYSSRARAGATVATPVTWSEVTPKLDPSKFTIKTVPARVKRQKEDPWKDYESARKELKLQEVIAQLQADKKA